MMSEQFTEIGLKNLSAKSKQFDVSDGQVPGFGMRVSPGGTKTFHVFYRMGKKKRRMTIGRYPDLSLKNARTSARAALKQVAEGKDPQAEKQARRDDYELELFREVVDDYIRKHVEKNTKPRSAAETKRILLKKFVPKWGRLLVSGIDKKMVLATLDEIRDGDGPSAANHAFSAVRHFFNWCIERDHLKHSPCGGLKTPAPKSERKRVLNDWELAAVWAASEEMGYFFGHFVQLLILTGQRRTEVAALRWSDLDLEKCVWTQSFNKSDRLHYVPLSRQAVKIIEAIPRVHNDLVFPARGNRSSISGFSKCKKRLDEICGVADWQLNDLRRTCASMLAEMKVPVQVVELTLNHNSKSLGGVAGIYNRYKYLSEKCAALQDFADRVEGIVGEREVNAEIAKTVEVNANIGERVEEPVFENQDAASRC
jgi:integrase